MWHFRLQFIFLPWLWFRVEPLTGAVFWHCLFGKGKKGEVLNDVFHMQYLPLALLATWDWSGLNPSNNCCLLCRSDFLGDTLSVMHEVMDSCLILVALSSRVPWCPSFVSTRGVTAVICKSCHNYPRLSSFPTAWLLQSFHSMSARKLHPWVYPWPRSVSFALQN